MKEKIELSQKELDKIIDDLKNGICQSEICEKLKITPAEIKKYIVKNQEFAEAYRDAMSLYAQKKIDEIEKIGNETKNCKKREDLTKLKAQEVQISCIVKSLAYLFPEKYKEKSNELFINLPAFGAAQTPKERLKILAIAVCDKQISVDSAEKLARMCEIELKVSDFQLFSEEITQRIDRIENIIAKTSGVIPISSRVSKEAQY